MLNTLFFLLNKVKKKIREIRRSDERVKRNWLIVCAAAAMLIVTSAWVFYLNITVPKVTEGQEVSKPEVKTKEEVGRDSIFSVFSRGFQITTRSISDAFDGMFERFSELISNAEERLKNVREYTPDDLLE